MKKYLLIVVAAFCLVGSIKTKAQVSFGAAVHSGCAPLFVNFLDSSSVSGITSRAWWYTIGTSRVYMGPGGAAGIGYLFALPGVYTITYIVIHGGITDSLRRTLYVNVFDKPHIHLSITPDSGCFPLTVCFDRSLTTAGCGSLTKVIVDLGGGLVDSSNTTFCHTYTSPGLYDVSVVAQNSCGCQSFAFLNDTIDVGTQPIASFSASPTSSCSSPVTVIFAPGAGLTGPGFTYSWDFQNDGIWDATTASPSHSYTIGNYTVKFAVCNPQGCCDTVVVPNAISVQSNTVNFSTTGATTICEGGTVCLHDLSTGPAVGWSWTMAPPAGATIPSVANPCFVIPTYVAPGTYSISLTVTFSNGCTLTTTHPAVFTVHDAPNPNFTANDTFDCHKPFTTTFTNSSTTGGSGAAITTYTWSFPGGTPSTATGIGPFNVTYANYGVYNATLTVTDANGCTATFTRSSYIHVQQITGSFTATNRSGCPPKTTVFSSPSTTTIPGESIISWSWNFGDPSTGAANTSTLQNPTHTYNATGCYSITLIVTSTTGCLDTITNDSLVCLGTYPEACYSPVPDTQCFVDPLITFVLDSSCLVNAPDSILFNFGDGPPGRFSPLPDTIMHNYNDTGDFFPFFIVFNNGCPDTIPDTTTMVRIDGPIASFLDTFSCAHRLSIFVVDSAFADADSFFIDMGDTTSTLDTSTSIRCYWTYPAPGTYTVTVKEWNSITGCFDSTNGPVVVEDTFVDFRASDTVFCAPQNITFTNISSSRASGGTGNNTRWDFNDDPLNLFTLGPNSTPRANNYTVPGIYTVGMRNKSQHGCLDTIMKIDFLTVHGVIANWTADTTLCLGDPLIITNTSTAPITYIDSVYWDFGDPLTTTDWSNTFSPTYTYSHTGTFICHMVAFDSFGCQKAFNRTVLVLAPTADMLLSDSLICTGHPLSVFNLSTATGATYVWNFPGGIPNTYTGVSPPSISYPVEGIFAIQLIVTDVGGCSASDWDTIHVVNPVAQMIGGPYVLPCPPFTLYGVDASYGDVNYWDWNFGDGSPHAYSQNPIHIYTIPGVYDVTLIVRSRTGCYDTLFMNDYITISGPTGTLTYNPHKGCPCTTVTFYISTANAQTLYFLPGDGLSILIPVTTPGTSTTPLLDTIIHTYCDTGIYSPRILVDDGVGCAIVLGTDSVVIDTINAKFGHLPFNFCDAGNVFWRDSSYSTVLSTGATQWFWTFGDGGTSTTKNPTHFYAAPGDYQIVLAVGNGTACFDTLKKSIHIPASPVANFICDSVGCVPLLSNFTDLSTFDTTIISWDWHFTTGATSTLQNPTYNFTSPGTFNVRLLIRDVEGCFDSIVKPVIVYPLPAVDAGPDRTVCSGDVVNMSASGASTYLWSPGSWLSDSTIRTPIANPPVPTTYTVFGTDIHGCVNSDTVRINAVKDSAAL